MIKSILTIIFSIIIAQISFGNGEFKTLSAGIGIKSDESKSGQVKFLNSDGVILVGAKVLIGFAANDPFPNNELVTNNEGMILTPSDWVGALPVTVTSEDSTQTTFTDVLPTVKEMIVTFKDGTESLELKGVTTGFGNLNRDGMVDFGLVIPGFKMQDLLHFDLSTVISPEVDQIKVAGQKIDLPSNLTLPKQTENYIIPITLDKQKYRTNVKKKGNYTFFSLHGKFPFKTVIDGVRAGKGVLDLINHFEFVEGGLKSVEVARTGTRADMPINGINFDSTVPAQAPQFNPEKSMVSLALAQMDQFLVPTDVKKLEPGQTMSLKATSQSSQMKVLYVLTNTPPPSVTPPEDDFIIGDDINWGQGSKDPISVLVGSPVTESNTFHQLSFVLKDSNDDEIEPLFIDMIDLPEVSTESINVQTPQVPNGITPLATYMVFSEVEKIIVGKATSEKKTRLWEVMAENWVGEVKLPNFTFERKQDRIYRWEVLYLGTSKTLLSPLRGVDSINLVTHVSRNAVELP